MWTYKGIEIEVDVDGHFQYWFKDKCYREEDTLEGAKRSIDKVTKSYYTITKQDVVSLLNKLNDKEKHFIKSVLEELDDHYKSAYCQVDSDSPFQYDFKIEEL